MHRNRNRIVTAEKTQPISQKESLRTVWLRKRIADFDRKSSPGDGVHLVWHLRRQITMAAVTFGQFPVQIGNFLQKASKIMLRKSSANWAHGPYLERS